MRRPPKLEWLGLMDVVGPFVTPTIIAEAFPNGLEGHDSSLLKGLRGAYKTWEDSDDPIYHREWVNVVLTSVLGYQEKHIQQDQAIPESLSYIDRTHHTTIRPTFVIHQPEFPDRGRMLVIRLPKGESASKPKAEAKWQASPISQMQMLLQATNEKIGLVTNGEEWVLVNSCGTGAVGFATWYAYLWPEEHDTLRSFRSLLGIRRVFGGEPEQRLVALLTKGSEDQQEVTDRLGYQVRRAVEELVGAFERLDRDSKRELLKSVSETQVYEGVLTVMMRLVFLFCAEERGLLHLGEQLYDDFYAVSTLREQLHDDASKLTEEVLDRRSAAWCRLLATFQMVYQGVAHEDLRIPAYGGTLFDPDRFPWLEGRTADNLNEPPHVSDRIVLHLLDSLQVLRQGQEARKLSFHALDVEQIGHVYEGLLDHTAKRATKPVLGLVGKEGDEPEVALETLEAKVADGQDKFIAYLKEQTGKTDRALDSLINQVTDSEKLRKIRVTCGDDHELFERIKPFANLIREDSFGNVQVYPQGALYATAGSDRRSTGTHYTPKSLCEEVVKYALEPMVYIGPAEGLLEDEWKLKSAKTIVDLKVCDMAMGSGAFLVAACRYLSIKLVEAWAVAEGTAERRLGFSAEGHYFTNQFDFDKNVAGGRTQIVTPLGSLAVADFSQELLPDDAEERLAFARRIIADRCLYGVDRNAMAVEMAKLSIWLTTLRKDRPFTFLDHALRHGDSLLGVSERQLELFSMETSGQSEALLLPWVPEYIEKIRKLRLQISRIPSHDPEAIRRKQRLFEQVRELEGPLKFAADALVACELSEGNVREKATRKLVVQSSLTNVPDKERQSHNFKELTGRPTFHWEIEFPDVFGSKAGGATDEAAKFGFDALVGNPPFLGGKKISGTFGDDYRAYIANHIGGKRKGVADFSVFFLLNGFVLLSSNGTLGLITTSSIAEGDTREVGLDFIVAESGEIISAFKNRIWPGTASVTFSIVILVKSSWSGVRWLDGESAAHISSALTNSTTITARPKRLNESQGRAFLGTYILGTGFTMAPEVAIGLCRADERYEQVLFPFLSGGDMNDNPDHAAPRWIINFASWPLTKASAPEGYTGAVAEDYPDLLEIVRRDVKPLRDSGNRKVYRERWWQFGEKAVDLYRAISSKKWVMGVASAATKYTEFGILPVGIIYGHSLTIVASDEFSMLAVLSSEIHKTWVREYASYNLSLIRYTPSDCLETFPFPKGISDLENIGEQFALHRHTTMRSNSEGLTKTYNRIHSPTDNTPSIVEMRELLVELDKQTALAYDWKIELGHGFHNTPQGLRFTISPDARKEVLGRLLKLNHERYAEEVAAGLHDKKAKKARDANAIEPKRGRKPKSTPGDSIVRESTAEYDASGLESIQRDLFDQQLALGDAEL